LYINSDYRDLLAEAGLEQFQEFVDRASQGELVASDKGRTTHRLQLAGKTFYLKSVRKPILAPMLEAVLSLRKPHHYCWREKLQVDALKGNNIGVMDVAAAGESTTGGILDFSFLLAPEVEGTFLDQIFAKADREKQLALLEQLGDLVGQLHGGGFFAPVRMKDIVVDETGRFVMIDRETRKPGSRRFSQRSALQGLGRTLARQARDGVHWEQEELQTHLRAYGKAVGPRLGLSETELLKQVRESTRKATRKKGQNRL
jgi:tRNA A-37 threonylcarbamoyl transferase component Bud32